MNLLIRLSPFVCQRNEPASVLPPRFLREHIGEPLADGRELVLLRYMQPKLEQRLVLALRGFRSAEFIPLQRPSVCGV